jgi:hypothetical protein
LSYLDWRLHAFYVGFTTGEWDSVVADIQDMAFIPKVRSSVQGEEF